MVSSVSVALDRFRHVIINSIERLRVSSGDHRSILALDDINHVIIGINVTLKGGRHESSVVIGIRAVESEAVIANVGDTVAADDITRYRDARAHRTSVGLAFKSASHTDNITFGRQVLRIGSGKLSEGATLQNCLTASAVWGKVCPAARTSDQTKTGVNGGHCGGLEEYSSV